MFLTHITFIVVFCIIFFIQSFLFEMVPHIKKYYTIIFFFYYGTICKKLLYHTGPQLTRIVQLLLISITIILSKKTFLDFVKSQLITPVRIEKLTLRKNYTMRAWMFNPKLIQKLAVNFKMIWIKNNKERSKFNSMQALILNKVLK